MSSLKPIATYNTDSSSLIRFVDQRSLLEPPQMHNFVFLFIWFLILMWAMRALAKGASMYQLWTASQRRLTVRLDGIQNPYMLHRDEYIALLRSRSYHSLHVVKSLHVGAHCSSVQLIKNRNAQGDISSCHFEFEIETCASTLVFLHLGAMDEALKRLINNASSIVQKSRKQSSSNRLKASSTELLRISSVAYQHIQSKQSGAVSMTLPSSSSSSSASSSDSVDAELWKNHMLAQAELAQTTLNFKAGECKWSASPFWLPANVKQTVRISIPNLTMLAQQVINPNIQIPLLLVLISVPVPAPPASLASPVASPTRQTSASKYAVRDDATDSPKFRFRSNVRGDEDDNDDEDGSVPDSDFESSGNAKKAPASKSRFGSKQLERKAKGTDLPEHQFSSADAAMNSQYDVISFDAELENSSFCAELTGVHITVPANPVKLTSSSTAPVVLKSMNQARFERQLILSDRSFLDELDIYGIEDVEETDCQICLTNIKNIIFLPCRHCCVCNECFARIDKCPSCRCIIKSHFTFVAHSEPSVSSSDGEDSIPSSSEVEPSHPEQYHSVASSASFSSISSTSSHSSHSSDNSEHRNDPESIPLPPSVSSSSGSTSTFSAESAFSSESVPRSTHRATFSNTSSQPISLAALSSMSPVGRSATFSPASSVSSSLPASSSSIPLELNPLFRAPVSPPAALLSSTAAAASFIQSASPLLSSAPQTPQYRSASSVSDSASLPSQIASPQPSEASLSASSTPVMASLHPLSPNMHGQAGHSVSVASSAESNRGNVEVGAYPVPPSFVNIIHQLKSSASSSS